MSEAENIERVRTFFDERWNHGNTDIIDEMVAPELDPPAWKEFVRSTLATFGDMEFIIESVLAKDNQVVVHWRLSATHQGDFLGVPATGKRVTNSGIAWLWLADGKIVKDISYWNDLPVLEQLKAAPE